MSPETLNDPNNPVLSRELYNLILRAATLPVLLFLLGLSWFLINRLMNSEWRQERRNREIRKAVATRQARAITMPSEKTILDETISPR